jgi:hypothetical protein
MLTGGIQIPHPKFFLKERSLKLDSFKELHRLHPGLLHLYDLSGLLQGKGDVHMDQRFRIIGASGLSKSGAMNLTVEKNVKESGVEIQDISGFMKVTHLLDPISWLRGKYEVEDVSGAVSFFKEVPNEKIKEKLNNSMNQAYVEAVASYSLSKLREGDVSPHFHYFYGAFRGISETYSYNISDVFASYRHCRWFWDHQETGIFELSVDNEESLEKEVLEAIFEPPSTLHSETSSNADDETEELDSIDGPLAATAVELESLSTTSMESVSYKEDEDATDEDASEAGDDEDEDDDDSDDDSENDSLNVLAKIHNFPVMVLFTESSEGTMDSLLENFDEVGAKPNTKKWDEIWLAWVFQIISALCVVQAMFGFSHNDLHTNNIVWIKTDIKFLHYRSRDGTTWKIPTYGKLFRIIDFGRAIFWVNKKLFCSDDFSEGNDAADQYNFGPLKTDDFSPEVHPNPSFDLCRLAVSLFEGLFPVEPLIKKGALILSAEPGLKVKETESDLYNLLWSWMIDEDGCNVMMEPNGKERYPDFDLYKVIAAKVHEAVPSEQITRPIFDKFRVSKNGVGKAKVYNLFC